VSGGKSHEFIVQLLGVRAGTQAVADDTALGEAARACEEGPSVLAREHEQARLRVFILSERPKRRDSSLFLSVSW
jgi:hypothetical protein